MRSFLTLWSIAVVVWGCGKSKTVGDDAGIVFDASRPDVSSEPDAGPEPDADVPPSSDIGQACRGDEDCEGLCINDWPGGYCTNSCGTGADCPEGSTCTPIGRGQQICLLDCDPTDTDPCERGGYGCTSDFRFPSVCVPGCSEDSDCTDGLRCDPEGGFGGACYDPSASIGDPCTNDEECTASGFCLAEFFAGWPAGACIAFGCDVASNTGCEGDAQCLPSMGGGGLCFDGCASSSDCRDGYTCGADNDFPDRSICRPGCTDDAQCTGGRVCNPALGTCDEPFNPDSYGMPCSTTRGACAGGTCFSEFATGFPGSFCTYAGCDASADDAGDGCPGDGVCLESDDGVNYCIPSCTDDGDCRTPDYSCRDVDPTDPSAGQGCLPSCANDAACANDGTGRSPDFSCNPGTGLCTYPFESARLGEPCEDIEECPGGACLDEATEGWPAGTCAAVGCRLSGTGPAQACPPGGVCVDDGEGDPEIGVCLTACSTEASGECRAGYACVALASSTDGACRPACEAGGCSGGRTCNTATGLCE